MTSFKFTIQINIYIFINLYTYNTVIYVNIVSFMGINSHVELLNERVEELMSEYVDCQHISRRTG